MVAEEVAEDPEQQHDPREQDHEPEDGPHHAPEIHVPLLSTRVVHTALGATPPVMGQPSPLSPPTCITRFGRGRLGHARPPCSATSVSSTSERTARREGVQVSVHESLEMAAVPVELAVRPAGDGPA